MYRSILSAAIFALMIGPLASEAAESTDDETSYSLTDDELFPLIPERSEDGYVHIEWDSLMPGNFGLENLESASSAELVQALIGEKVSIPGFVVALDMDQGKVLNFLFVPYMGACIHVPPPPPNQLIYVKLKEPLELDDQWSPMELYGTLGAEFVETDIGAAGYTMDVDEIKPFSY